MLRNLFRKPEKKPKLVFLNLSYLTLDESTIQPMTKELSRHLVESIFPEETQIFDLVADEIIAAQSKGAVIKPSDLKVSGLPMGNLSDLGSIQAIGFAGLILQQLYNTYSDSPSIPALAKIIDERKEMADELIELARLTLGIDQKSARSFWEKTVDWIAPRYEFIYDQQVTFTEERSIEFKNVNIKNIPKEVFEYIIAYLNGDGGRVFFGIQNNDGKVVGVEVQSPKQKDEINKSILENVFLVVPPISPACIEIKYHEIQGLPNNSSNRYVIEVIVPKPVSNVLYSTNHGTIYLKTDSGRKEANADMIADEKKRRGITE